MLPENRAAVVQILEELSPRVVGQKVDGWSCNCGCIKGAAGTVSEIRPGGEEYPGHEVRWPTWNVRIEPLPGETAPGWSASLSQFIPVEELRELFGRHFGESAD